MSTTIDQRVVEMQFDNRHFERNVSTTMSTLDKFKQKLHLDGATKGLDNVNAAAKNVNLSPLGSAIDSVQTKFSAMQVVGVTALANITNSAVNAGKRMISALTIDPVKTGFKEYETQINAVQTILANTESKGTTIDDVNKALDELNTYADKTIYNFTEMTRNIGTFTAAGVDLDTSVNAIQGIANLAAVSGSTSQQASTAMYQLSQALASGTVKLMDWNSVVNAGMGGEVFQNALKETARVHGVAIDDMIKNEGSFRETLSKGWLTSEILTETLQKFTLTTEGLTEEQIKANREMLKAKGYTDEQIDGIFKLGNTATNAATKVKTFTQLWDVLKESAQSGWAQTWKILIGDFEEAKALLTPVADVLTGIINKFSNARNEVLEKVFGGGKDSKWKGISKVLDKAGLSMHDLNEASELLTGSSDKLNKSLEGTSTYTVKKGDYLYKIAKEYGTTWQEIYNLNKDIIDDPDLIYPAQVLKMPGVFEEMANGMGDLTDEQLRNLGYTDEQIEAWRELEKVAKENGMTVGEVIAELSKPPSGRELLIDALKNAFDGFKKVMAAIRDAWQSIFPPKTADEKAAAIYKFLVALNEFSQKLIMSEGTADKLTRTLKGVFAIIDIITTITGGAFKIAFKVLSAVLQYFNLDLLSFTAMIGDAIVRFRDWIDSLIDLPKWIGKIIPLIKTAAEYVGKWFNALKSSGAFKSFTGWLVSAGKAIWNWLKGLKNLVPYIKTAAIYIGKWFSKLKESSVFKTFTGWLVSAGKAIWNWIKGLRNIVPYIKKAAEYVGSWFGKLKDSSAFKSFINWLTKTFTGIKDWIKGLKEAENVPAYIISGLVNGLKAGIVGIAKVVGLIGKTIIEAICNVLGIHSPSTVMIAIGGFIIAGLLKGLLSGVPEMEGTIGGILGTLKAAFAELDLGKIFAGLMTSGLVVGFVNISKAFMGFGDMMSGVGGVLGAAEKIMRKSTGSINKILKNTAGTVKAFNGVLKSMAFETTTNGIKNMAISIAILAAAVFALSYIKPAKLWNAVAVIAVLTGILAGLAILMSKMSQSSVVFDKESKSITATLKTGLLGIAMSLLLIAVVLRLVGGMDPEEAKQGFLGLAGMIVALGVIIAAYGLLVKGDAANNMDKAAKMFSKLATTLLILAIVAKIIGGMEWGEMGKAAAGIGGMAVIIIAFMAATKLINGSKNVDTIGGTLLKIAITIAIMAHVVKTLAKTDESAIKKGVQTIIAFGGLIVGLMAATKLITGSKNVDTIGGTLLKIALAIGIMALVVKMISGMEPESILKGVGAVGAFALLVIGFMKFSKLVTGSKNMDKIGDTILKIGLAIGIMGLTVRIVGTMEIGEILKGTLAIAAFAGIIIGLTKFSKLTSDKEMVSLGKTLISMSVAIGVLALAVALLGFLEIGHIIKGTLAVAALGVLVSYMTKATEKAKRCQKNIYAMAAAIAVMAIAVGILSFIDAAKLAVATASLSAVMGMFTLIVKNTKGLTDKPMKSLIVMSAMIGILGIILYNLAKLPVGNVIGSATALSMLVAVLTGVIWALSKIDVKIGDALNGAVSLAVLAVAISAFVIPLKLMNGVQNAITNSLVLVILTAAMTALLIPLSAVGSLATQALMGVLALTAMVVPLFAFVGALAVMSGVQNAAQNAIILGLLTAAMTILLIPLALVGVLAVQALMGVLALTAMAVPLFAFVGVLAVMNCVQNATQNATALAILASALAIFMIPLVVVGALAVQALLGVLALTAMAVPLLAFIGVLALMQGVSDAAANANVLVTIMAAMTDAIVKISLVAPLALVAVAAMAALGLVAVGLVGVLAILGGLSLIPGFSELVEGGGAMLVSVGTSLSNFINSMSGFIAGACQIDPSMIAGVKALAETILVLTGAGILDGIASFITGESSIEKFAEQLPILGNGLSAFANSVGTFTEDQFMTVQCAAQSIKALAQAASEIPNAGGLLASIVGENDMGTFANQFPVLGSGLAAFLRNVGVFSDQQVKTVSCAADAVSKLASVASDIPNTGGLLGSIVGNNDLSQFATQFPVLGFGLFGFVSNVGTFTDTQAATVDCAANAIESLANVASKIPNSGGFWSKIVGDNDLGDFAAKFPDVASGIRGFADKLGSFGNAQLATVQSGIKAVEAITKLAKVNLNSAAGNITSFSNSFIKLGLSIAYFCAYMPPAPLLAAVLVNLTRLTAAIKTISDVNSGALGTLADNFEKLGKNAVAKFIAAFSSSSAALTVKVAANRLATQAISGLKNLPNEGKKAGNDLGTGLVLGILSKQKAVYNAGYRLGQKAVQGEKDGQKSKSPSRLTMQAGKWLGEGLIIGIEQMGDKVYAAGHYLGRTATDSMSSSISRIVDTINSDVDTQPTIRPVLDLTNVRAGASTINGLFDTQSSIGVVANVGRISGMMNEYSQNGANSEVVSAINKLNKRMDNLGNTTYQINGVTYDDGSNITDAVRTIVRAAKIERRT